MTKHTKKGAGGARVKYKQPERIQVALRVNKEAWLKLDKQVRKNLLKVATVYLVGKIEGKTQ